jgi:hypothetical protein
VKALSVQQPWATFIARRVKKIETRSKPVKYRGPLAIHASARIAPGMDTTAGMFAGGRFTVHRDGRGEPWYLLDQDWEGREYGTAQYPIALPLGAVVATCTLVDCLPILGVEDCPFGEDHIIEDPRGVLSILRARGGRYWSDGVTNVSHELPFGNFTPGRFGYVLANIVELSRPVPAKGMLGLWEWSEAA